MTAINLHIDKESELTAHDQLREQIIFLISTGQIQIGTEMPSVRGLARQLGVSLNTVSKVYSGLVRGGWLIDHPGAHHKVVERKRRTKAVVSAASLDGVVDHAIELALGSGFSLQQLSDRLRQRLLEQTPDHLLIVEPDPGMGEIMQEEIGARTGHRPARCSLSALQQNPAISAGALLIVPVYMTERLRQVPLHCATIVEVSYSSLEGLMEVIGGLSRASMIGWVSVSAAGLKTISGMAAPAVSNRHTSHLFLLERLESRTNARVVMRRFEVGDYQPGDILHGSEKPDMALEAASQRRDAEGNGTVSASDLQCMDLLFVDSVATRFVEHPRAVCYRLLSEMSLERIEAAVRRLRHEEYQEK